LPQKHALLESQRPFLPGHLAVLIFAHQHRVWLVPQESCRNGVPVTGDERQYFLRLLDALECAVSNMFVASNVRQVFAGRNHFGAAN
jgi:hypothetical protein